MSHNINNKRRQLNFGAHMKKIILFILLFLSTNSFANEFGCFNAKTNLKNINSDVDVTEHLKNYCEINRNFSVAAGINDSKYRTDKKILICCHLKPGVDLEALQEDL